MRKNVDLNLCPKINKDRFFYQELFLDFEQSGETIKAEILADT